ncbi:hypothetical protein PINS_up011382 [Pythium insidiosum]|nr:hypothetical protein PINS_up011382 [Pythium insidiosum]
MEAEGLLDVLAKLLPSLSISFLVKHWALIFPTLERYVVHIASSVRQRSSLVIAALVELCQRQHQSRVSAQANSESTGSSPPEMELLASILLALAKNDSDQHTVCWQRLEGRLLSIDIVISRLGKELVLRHIGPHGVCSTATPKHHATKAGTVSTWLPVHAISQATWSLEDDEKQEFIGPHDGG